MPQTKLTLVPDAFEPSPCSAIVCGKAFELDEKKLIDNSLPPLDLQTPSQAEENIEALVKALSIV